MKPRMPHQEEGFRRLLAAYGGQKPGYILAWAMRAGKSRTSVEFIAETKPKKAVVVCPAQVRKNWAREFRKWTNLEATLVSPGKKVDVSAPGVYVVSYELAKRFGDEEAGSKANIVVFDEVHYLASEKSLRSLAARTILGEGSFAIGLSGTPIPNTVRDLWNQVDTIVPGALGSAGGFIVRYSNRVPNEYAPSGFVYTGLRADRAEELQAKLAPFWHRVVKQDFAHLLPKFDVVPRYVTPKRKKFDWDNEAVFEELLAANSPLKLDTMMEVLDEAIEGGQKKFCVGAWLHQTVDQVAGLCRARGWSVHQVDGRLVSDERLDEIDRWRIDEGVSVLVAGIGAVGIGLSLSAAETSVMVEIPWRPEQLDQFVARFNDAEHDHASQLVPIIIDGSREERAINRYVTKRSDIDLVVTPSITETQTKKAFEDKNLNDEAILAGLV